MVRNNIVINIPVQINVIIWLNKKNKNILKFFLFNESKKVNFVFNTLKSDVNYDVWSNSILLNKKKLTNYNIKISNLVFNFLKSWDTFYFLKIKFKGKGFRIRFLKKLKLVKFFFGRSHKTFILFKFILIKRVNKYKFIIKNLKKEKLMHIEKKILNIKPINFYTLRGLRNSRQIIFKRKGKKGTYI